MDYDEDPAEDRGPASECGDIPAQAAGMMGAKMTAPRRRPRITRRELLDFAATIADLVEQRVPPGGQRCKLRRLVETLLNE